MCRSNTSRLRAGSTRFLLAIPVLLMLVASRPAQAAGEDEDCGEKSTTADIVSCIEEKVVEWDRVLQEAVATSLQSASPEYVRALQKAQALWVEFRDANCLTYQLGEGEGTVPAVEAAECRLRMTKERAAELGAEVPD